MTVFLGYLSAPLIHWYKSVTGVTNSPSSVSVPFVSVYGSNRRAVWEPREPSTNPFRFRSCNHASPGPVPFTWAASFSHEERGTNKKRIKKNMRIKTH